MFKSRLTWLILASAFLGCLVFVRFNFTKANSIVNIRITMDAQSAIREATIAKEKFALGPQGARSAAIFSLDDMLQTFVELEAGGKAAFADVLKEGIVSPYTWEVRFFRENEVNETTIAFTPAGKIYGFSEIVSETAPGPVLEEADARALAERAATNDWSIDLSSFAAVETSKEVMPGGRVDHTFVYERPSERIGEGRYRLRLMVSGDRLTQLMQFVKIPESFDRRYEEMRSANETIATIASVIVYVFYIGAGCFGGLFFLLRRRYLMWKTAFVVGAAVALLGALSQMNNLPAMWMNYDTAESVRLFLAQFFSMVIVSFILDMFLLALTFMVAESLSRCAFPHMAQLWKTWSGPAASSKDIAGQTVLGFLMIGFLLAYDVALYLFGNNWLHWWAPSDTLVDPNILGMYVPWLTPAANSLHAGFWEECLFRAVPLAGAALIGARFGKPRPFIAVTLVLQALVFGAAHANYPNQPAYARIVEITPAFIVFGLVYLRFGLLPVIVAHFGIDMAYMSLPLFFTRTPYIWADRIIAGLVFALPLIIVLLAIIRRGFHEFPAGIRNAAWKPSPVQEAPPHLQEAEQLTPERHFQKRWALVMIIGSVLAVMIWTGIGSLENHAPKLRLTREGAIDAANAALQSANMMPTGQWHSLTAIMAEQGQAESYIWQEYDALTYDVLQELGHLASPSWHVALTRFDGSIDVAERAETFEVVLAGTGEVVRVTHNLPEARPGKDMTVDEARNIADDFLSYGVDIDTTALGEISIEPTKRPNRTDMFLVLAYTNEPPFTNTEMRVLVAVADGKVVDYDRTFHVPEKWAREDQARRALYAMIEMGCNLTVVFVIFAGLVWSVVMWSRGRIHAMIFARTALALVSLGLAGMINAWPAETAEFSTAQPWVSQVLRNVALRSVGLLLLSPAIALLFAAAAWNSRRTRSSIPAWPDFAATFGSGLIAGIAVQFVIIWAPSWQPYWPDFQDANSTLPLFQVAIRQMGSFLIHVSFLLFVLHHINRWTAGKRWPARLGILLPLGVVLAGAGETTGLFSWMFAGLLVGLLIFLANERFLADRPHLLPPLYAGFTSVMLAGDIAINAYPGAASASLLAILTVAWFATLMFRWLATAPVEAEPSPPPSV